MSARLIMILSAVVACSCLVACSSPRESPPPQTTVPSAAQPAPQLAAQPAPQPATPAVVASDAPTPEAQLRDVDEKLAQNPSDPMLSYRRAQFLAALGRFDESYAAAQVAMQRFAEAKNDLAWLMLESMTVEKHRVDVHFNMGPRERTPPPMGIVRPLTFRIWTTDGPAELVEMIDFEFAYIEGQPATAAFGKMTRGGGHENYGTARVDMTYSEIRKAAAELIARRLKSAG